MIIIYFLRSVLYDIYFFINMALLALILVDYNLFHNRKKFIKRTKSWAMRNINMLKIICGVDYKILGAENVTNDSGLLAVSKHQSSWECYFLFAYLPDDPVCVSKKEIRYIPIFGPALSAVGNMIIDRDDGISSVKILLKKSKYFYENGRRTFLIFPQGTRVSVDSNTDKYPYKPGALAIAIANKLDILPISLNSGNIWPKGKFIKKPGVITVKFMPMIKYSDYKNMDKNELMKTIENIIEENQKMIQ